MDWFVHHIELLSAVLIIQCKSWSCKEGGSDNETGALGVLLVHEVLDKHADLMMPNPDHCQLSDCSKANVVHNYLRCACIMHCDMHRQPCASSVV